MWGSFETNKCFNSARMLEINISKVTNTFYNVIIDLYFLLDFLLNNSETMYPFSQKSRAQLFSTLMIIIRNTF